VHDPAVLAIKQTIYRTGAQSELMDLLIEAARRGQGSAGGGGTEGALRRRSQHQLGRAAGSRRAQVVYGIVGLKTHGKMLLVTRREKGRLRRYAHLSTGNYNPRTARLYTDMGCLTADPA